MIEVISRTRSWIRDIKNGRDSTGKVQNKIDDVDEAVKDIAANRSSDKYLAKSIVTHERFLALSKEEFKFEKISDCRRKDDEVGDDTFALLHFLNQLQSR